MKDETKKFFTLFFFFFSVFSISIFLIFMFSCLFPLFVSSLTDKTTSGYIDFAKFCKGNELTADYHISDDSDLAIKGIETDVKILFIGDQIRIITQNSPKTHTYIIHMKDNGEVQVFVTKNVSITLENMFVSQYMHHLRFTLNLNASTNIYFPELVWEIPNMKFAINQYCPTNYTIDGSIFPFEINSFQYVQTNFFFKGDLLRFPCKFNTISNISFYSDKENATVEMESISMTSGECFFVLLWGQFIFKDAYFTSTFLHLNCSTVKIYSLGAQFSDIHGENVTLYGDMNSQWYVSFAHARIYTFRFKQILDANIVADPSLHQPLEGGMQLRITLTDLKSRININSELIPNLINNYILRYDQVTIQDINETCTRSYEVIKVTNLSQYIKSSDICLVTSDEGTYDLDAKDYENTCPKDSYLLSSYDLGKEVFPLPLFENHLITIHILPRDPSDIFYVANFTMISKRMIIKPAPSVVIKPNVLFNEEREFISLEMINLTVVVDAKPGVKSLKTDNCIIYMQYGFRCQSWLINSFELLDINLYNCCPTTIKMNTNSIKLHKRSIVSRNLMALVNETSKVTLLLQKDTEVDIFGKAAEIVKFQASSTKRINYTMGLEHIISTLTVPKNVIARFPQNTFDNIHVSGTVYVKPENRVNFVIMPGGKINNEENATSTIPDFELRSDSQYIMSKTAKFRSENYKISSVVEYNISSVNTDRLIISENTAAKISKLENAKIIDLYFTPVSIPFVKFYDTANHVKVILHFNETIKNYIKDWNNFYVHPICFNQWNKVDVEIDQGDFNETRFLAAKQYAKGMICVALVAQPLATFFTSGVVTAIIISVIVILAIFIGFILFNRKEEKDADVSNDLFMSMLRDESLD